QILTNTLCGQHTGDGAETDPLPWMSRTAGKVKPASVRTAMSKSAFPHKPGRHNRIHAVSVQMVLGSPLFWDTSFQNAKLRNALPPPALIKQSLQISALALSTIALGTRVIHRGYEPCRLPAVPTTFGIDCGRHDEEPAELTATR